MRAVVFANGSPPSGGLVAEVVAGAGLVVAADGGVDRAHAAGDSVDALDGDLDSASQSARAWLAGDQVHLDTDPETTDLQKAIEYCLRRGATEVDVLAAGGGRADHALANLSMPVLFRGRARVRLIDDQFEISLVESQTTFTGPVGSVVSLVAIGSCQGVTTTGLRWDLEDATLPFGPRGVHNEVRQAPVTVRVRHGDLLLFRGRWVERHG